METKTRNWRLKFLGVAIVSAAIVVIAAASSLMYQTTVNLLTDNLRQRLLSIGITQATNINPADLEALQAEDDWKKPEWKRVVRQLKRAKDTNPNIVFMYVFRKVKDHPDQLVFVADAESINPYANSDNDPNNDIDANKDGKIEPDGPDYLQWPGQEYDEPPVEAFSAYSGPLTNQDLYSDSYGQVLTGYAPIKDSSGNVVAILATDIKADDFFTVTRQTFYPFALFIIFLVLAIVILSMTLIKIWNKRVEAFAELDRQKDELIGIISHQLATPVTSLKWYLEMMLDGDVGELTKKQADHVTAAQAIAENLSGLVSMILNVSRIELGKVKIEKQDLDLHAFFNEILTVIAPRAKEKGVVFNKSLPEAFPVAKLDKSHTHMTIENLLSNAVKYTPKGGKVDFSVEIDGDMLLCKVSDTGCGIPKEDQGKIFQKLYRAKNVRNSVDGNGFGLYVAKGAVEAQGGKMTFVSAEGKGTTFFVELPLK